MLLFQAKVVLKETVNQKGKRSLFANLNCMITTFDNIYFQLFTTVCVCLPHKKNNSIWTNRLRTTTLKNNRFGNNFNSEINTIHIIITSKQQGKYLIKYEILSRKTEIGKIYIFKCSPIIFVYKLNKIMFYSEEGEQIMTRITTRA